MLQFVNLAYHHAEERIRNEINEEYFYDYFTTSTVATQNEYVLPVPASNTVGILKPISVGIKWNDTTDQYSPVRPYTAKGLYNTDEYTQVNQSQGNPFYIVKDYSVFIYPAPITAVLWGLRVHASTNLVDLQAGQAESYVKIPRNLHEAIAIKAATYAYLNRSLGGTAIAIDTDNRALRTMDTMIDNLRDRNLQPMEQDMPVLTSIMY